MTDGQGGATAAFMTPGGIEGKVLAEGTLDEIRTKIPDVDADADLETLFLKATKADDPE